MPELQPSAGHARQRLCERPPARDVVRPRRRRARGLLRAPREHLGGDDRRAPGRPAGDEHRRGAVAGADDPRRLLRGPQPALPAAARAALRNAHAARCGDRCARAERAAARERGDPRVPPGAGRIGIGHGRVRRRRPDRRHAVARAVVDAPDGERRLRRVHVVRPSVPTSHCPTRPRPRRGRPRRARGRVRRADSAGRHRVRSSARTGAPRDRLDHPGAVGLARADERPSRGLIASRSRRRLSGGRRGRRLCWPASAGSGASSATTSYRSRAISCRTACGARPSSISTRSPSASESSRSCSRPRGSGRPRSTVAGVTRTPLQRSCSRSSRCWSFRSPRSISASRRGSSSRTGTSSTSSRSSRSGAPRGSSCGRTCGRSSSPPSARAAAVVALLQLTPDEDTVIFWASPAAAFRPALRRPPPGSPRRHDVPPARSVAIAVLVVVLLAWRAPRVAIAATASAARRIRSASGHLRVRALRRAGAGQLGARPARLDRRSRPERLVRRPRPGRRRRAGAVVGGRVLEPERRPRAAASPAARPSRRFPFSTCRSTASRGRLVGRQPSDYLVVASGETRFGLTASRTVALNRPLELLRVARPYRLAWASAGLTRDGWMLPGRPVTVRVFGGSASVRRAVQITLASSRLAAGRIGFALAAGGETIRGSVDPGGARPPVDVTVCVPARGHVDVRLLSRGRVQLEHGRTVALHVERISLSRHWPCAVS